MYISHIYNVMPHAHFSFPGSIIYTIYTVHSFMPFLHKNDIRKAQINDSVGDGDIFLWSIIIKI